MIVGDVSVQWHMLSKKVLFPLFLNKAFAQKILLNYIASVKILTCSESHTGSLLFFLNHNFLTNPLFGFPHMFLQLE